MSCSTIYLKTNQCDSVDQMATDKHIHAHMQTNQQHLTSGASPIPFCWIVVAGLSWTCFRVSLNLLTENPAALL